MPLKDRRSEYSWQETAITNVLLIPERNNYSLDEDIVLSYSFRLKGGLREAFRPDVWTIAWEDYDKFIRLHYYVELRERTVFGSRKVAETGKRVRKATFYWSRDPDLPYRIWTMIVPEDGGAPIIPTGVDDAKSRMFDFEGKFRISSSVLGRGNHKLYIDARVKWFRRSFIEKGSVESKSKFAEIIVS